METLFKDIRYGFRGLVKRKGFAAIAVLTLALGIGATTAIFSVVNAVIIKPLPYPDADAVVRVAHSAVTGGVRGDGRSFAFFSPQVLEVYEANGQAFEELGMYRSGQATIIGLADPERANTLVVTAGTLRALNVQPALGRWFSREDDQPGAADTAILSDAYWQRRFGGSDNVIGSKAQSGNFSATIVGVMPPGFRTMMPPDSNIPPAESPVVPPPAACAEAAPPSTNVRSSGLLFEPVATISYNLT